MLRKWLWRTRRSLLSCQYDQLTSPTSHRHKLSTSRSWLTRISSVTYSKSDKKENSESIESSEREYGKESAKELLDNAASYNEQPATPEDLWMEGPYPKNSDLKQSQAKFSKRPNIDPRSTSIIFFPGQGTQFVGMGKELLKYPNVKEMYEAASSILGYDLLDLCLNGPKTKLFQTKYQQPAIVVASLAAVEKLRDERPAALESCVGVAGYSVGEITALVFAGALSFEDAMHLVKVRAEAMFLASELTPSGMMTVMYGPDSRLGFACSVAKEFCQRKGLTDVDCRVASYLYPHCKVIAGNNEALSFIEQNRSDFKLRRLKRLPVSGAFHTNLMKPAVEPFKQILNNLHIEKPLVPIHSNVDGKRYKDANHIRKQLPKQLYSPVKWEQTLHVLYERHQGEKFPCTYECGPGNSLRGILKMVNAKAWDTAINIEA